MVLSACVPALPAPYTLGPSVQMMMSDSRASGRALDSQCSMAAWLRACLRGCVHGLKHPPAAA
jgi:hypothetical protein